MKPGKKKTKTEIRRWLRELQERADKAMEDAFAKPPDPEIVERVRRASMVARKRKGSRRWVRSC